MYCTRHRREEEGNSRLGKGGTLSGSLKGSSLPHHLLLSLLSYPPLDLKSLGGGGQTEKEKSYFFFKGRRAKSPPPPLSPNSPFLQGNPKAPLREGGERKVQSGSSQRQGRGEEEEAIFFFSLSISTSSSPPQALFPPLPWVFQFFGASVCFHSRSRRRAASLL